MTEAEKVFLNGWRAAAPVLEELKKQRLSEMDESAGLRLLGATNPMPQQHGMAVMQSWFMRWRAQQLMARLAQYESGPSFLPGETISHQPQGACGPAVPSGNESPAGTIR